jgi:hypothetical protein
MPANSVSPDFDHPLAKSLTLFELRHASFKLLVDFYEVISTESPVLDMITHPARQVVGYLIAG